MEPYTLSLYGLSVFLNRSRPGIALIAAAFFVIELGHYFLGFQYYATQFFSIALLTVVPVIVCRFVGGEVAARMSATCLGLICLYFAAWVTVEMGLENAHFFYAHLAILLYQFGVLNGWRGCGAVLLAFGDKLWFGFRRLNP